MSSAGQQPTPTTRIGRRARGLTAKHMRVAFFDDDSQRVIVLGPFSSVEEAGSEIKVPIDPDTMDDEAERFFCEAQLMDPQQSVRCQADGRR